MNNNGMAKSRKRVIYVTGESGQLGNEIKKASNENSHSFKFLRREHLDLCSDNSIINVFENNDFHYFINCAAYTNVEKAENYPKDADRVNHHAVKLIAEQCDKHDVFLIHISTDYVFDGQSEIPYREDSVCNPINEYGISKRNGEIAIEEISPKSIIIRTSWLYSSLGSNFITKIIDRSKKTKKISVVNDQYGSPTYAADLARTILKILDQLDLENDNEWPNILHYTNQGVCSWNEYAKEVFRILNINCKINEISTKDLDSALKRPVNTKLDTTKFSETFDIKIPQWETSLEAYLLGK
tara:strand:- start:11 stop:904 length:894 start_codon:yes stop_codon:yes gene_type:complete